MVSALTRISVLIVQIDKDEIVDEILMHEVLSVNTLVTNKKTSHLESLKSFQSITCKLRTTCTTCSLIPLFSFCHSCFI